MGSHQSCNIWLYSGINGIALFPETSLNRRYSVADILYITLTLTLNYVAVLLLYCFFSFTQILKEQVKYLLDDAELCFSRGL